VGVAVDTHFRTGQLRRIRGGGEGDDAGDLLGDTGTTRMPRPSSSAARLREKASTAPFDAEFAVMQGFPCSAALETTFTMTPLPSGRCCSASRADDGRADAVDLEQLMQVVHGRWRR